MSVIPQGRLFRRAAARLSIVALCAGLGWGLAARQIQAGPDARQIQTSRFPTPGRAAAAAADVKKPQPPARLHFLQPANGASLAAGDLRLRVAPTADEGQTVEVLIAWNSDPRGVTPVETCQVSLERLVSGVLVPASAIRGRTGGFTIQARIIAPDPGPLSAPTDITLVAAQPYENRQLGRPLTGDNLPVRSLRRSGGADLTCIH